MLLTSLKQIFGKTKPKNLFLKDFIFTYLQYILYTLQVSPTPTLYGIVWVKCLQDCDPCAEGILPCRRDLCVEEYQN